MPAPFWVQCIELGGNYNLCISEIRVWLGNDPRYISFGGDAYWQWQFGQSPYRSHGAGFNWSQALHDSLSGAHASILHAGNDRFPVLPEHPDYANVARLWELAQRCEVPKDFVITPC